MGTVDREAPMYDWRGISQEASDSLYEYLVFHEDDIAWEINDFGDLRPFFIYLMGREPNKNA